MANSTAHSAGSSRRNSMPTLSSIQKFRKALQSDRFKAMVKAMRKSNAAKEAQAEMQARLDGSSSQSAGRRHSLFALGAGMVDADRKKELRQKAIRAAAKTNQALALRLLEGKSLNGPTANLQMPTTPRRPFASPKSVPKGKFADAFGEAARQETDRERHVAKQVVLYGVGDGLVHRTWELDGVFPIREIKRDTRQAPMSGGAAKSARTRQPPTLPKPRPYPRSLEDLDQWEVGELFDMRYGAKMPSQTGAQYDRAADYLGPDGRATTPLTRLAIDLAGNGRRSRSRGGSRGGRRPRSGGYGLASSSIGDDSTEAPLKTLPTSTALRRRQLRETRAALDDAASNASCLPISDVPADSDVQRAEETERIDPAGGNSKTGKGRKNRRTSAAAISYGRNAAVGGAGGPDGSAGTELLPYSVPGAALDATITSTELKQVVEIVEHRTPKVSRAGVYKRVYVGPASRGWRWRAVVKMPSGQEAVIGDFDDQASAAVAHDVAVRRLYPSRPSESGTNGEPRTNFDLAGHLLQPDQASAVPRLYWPAASRSAAASHSTAAKNA